MNFIISADPGFTGAVAIISPGGDVFTLKTPLLEDDIDCEKIINFIKSFENIEFSGIIEDVHSVFNSSAKSNFQFGRALGIIEGIFSALKIKFTKVQPKIWQKQMFEGIDMIKRIDKGKEKTDTKAMALKAVQKIYPNANLLPTKRCKKPSDGIVDAILIAEYKRLQDARNTK